MASILSPLLVQNPKKEKRCEREEGRVGGRDGGREGGREALLHAGDESEGIFFRGMGVEGALVDEHGLVLNLLVFFKI